MLPRSAVDIINRLRRAHSRERLRVARELHDQVAHSLAVALNSLELHESYLEQDPRRARQHLQTATRSVRRALERVRALSTDLRSREVEDGLERAVADYLHAMSPPAVSWAVKVSGDDSGLPAELRDELFLILREAVRNSLIHAFARHLEVVVDVGADAVHATVSDNGRGFEPPERPSAGGLASMRERAHLLGGYVTWSSSPGAGTAVQVHVPLEIAADER